jgi:hypothetical protein
MGLPDEKRKQVACLINIPAKEKRVSSPQANPSDESSLIAFYWASKGAPQF